MSWKFFKQPQFFTAVLFQALHFLLFIVLDADATQEKISHLISRFG